MASLIELHFIFLLRSDFGGEQGTEQVRINSEVIHVVKCGAMGNGREQIFSSQLIV